MEEVVTPYSSNTPRNLGALKRWISERLASAKVHAFDPDFLVMLMIAGLTDTIDIINLTGVGKIITIPIDIAMILLMLVWTIWRSKMIENAEQDANEALEAYTEGTAGRKRIGAARAISRSAARKGAMGRAAVAAFKRVGLAGLAEIIPVLGLAPWWTILVLLSLRRRASLKK